MGSHIVRTGLYVVMLARGTCYTSVTGLYVVMLASGRRDTCETVARKRELSSTINRFFVVRVSY